MNTWGIRITLHVMACIYCHTEPTPVFSELQIVYHKSKAKLRDFLETAVIADDSQIFKCLQTKWPTIELEWVDCTAPSLN